MSETSLAIDPGAHAAILDAIAGLEGEASGLLAGLVRHRSVLGHEHGALDAMAAAYESLGLAPRRVPVEVGALSRHPGFSPPLIPYAGRDNVVAEHRPTTPIGRSLMLQGHATWCRKVRPICGPRHRSSRPSAMAGCTAVAPPT